MSDADGRFIPLVDDDQGEGIKNFYEGEYEKCSEIKKKRIDEFINMYIMPYPFGPSPDDILGKSGIPTACTRAYPGGSCKASEPCEGCTDPGIEKE